MVERGPDLVAALEADLAAIAAADADLERDSEVAERTRIERTGVSLRDRLRASRSPVEIATLGGGHHAGRVREVGADWVVLAPVVSSAAVPTIEHVVRLAVVVGVRGLGRAATLVPAQAAPRSLGSLLRAWCHDRSEVSVLAIDDSVTIGLASAAYADHVEVSTGGGGLVVVPYVAIAVVSR